MQFFIAQIKIRTMSYQSVLDYWFEPGKSNRWLGGGPAVDDEIKEKFGDMVWLDYVYIFILHYNFIISIPNKLISRSYTKLNLFSV